MSTPVTHDLTTEERALAERLSRLDARAAPAPAVDARILAAARAAVGVPRPVHRPSRWPVALGVAASLVLVAGLAWRMLPQPGAGTRAAPPAPRSGTGPRRGATPGVNAPVATPSSAPAAAEAPDTAERTAQDAARPQAAPEVPQATSRTAGPAVGPAQRPQAAPAPPAPPPPPVPFEPETPAAEAKAAAPAPVDDAGLQGDEAAQASALTSSAAAGDTASTSDEPLDATPPATADAPGVRDAWLSRIRALFDRGDIAGGRASLRAFVQRYPDYPLPEDLRALLR